MLATHSTNTEHKNAHQVVAPVNSCNGNASCNLPTSLFCIETCNVSGSKPKLVAINWPESKHDERRNVLIKWPRSTVAASKSFFI